MIDFEFAKIREVSAHYIGNRANGDSLRLSEAPIEVDNENIHALLRTYFLSNFGTPAFYTFTFSNEDFKLNPIYQFASQIFKEPESFHENSMNLAKHLYEATQHPNIKPGELYIAFFQSVEVQNDNVEAIGIFKSENKENYLKLSHQFSLHADEGINVKKLDKGCLILNREEDEGYKVLMVDNINKSDAHFWKHDFLNIKPRSDAFHHTHNFMQLTKQYVEEQLSEEFSVSKADKIDLLNRSMDFFRSNEEFSKSEFEVNVLGNVDVIESFRNFGNNFMTSNNIDPMDNFEISAQAVKRQARIFKSVLKLDKNFHIYIHGNRELIEKGFDEVTGKHFYKLYFENES
ncbi:MAG TPA: nucleoid-associated protein [Ohtaekwangia sp.]|uniref:nucleoid-associated protein n=1 Tax=Ohtaekwangia sp. TaxID=2066019 RepID=UPI002F956EA7